MSTDKESSVAGTDNRPPMLVESDYESWKILIESQGLPRHVFNILNQTRTGKEIWDNVELLMKGSEKSLQQKKEELFDEYERFRAIGNESIHDYFVCFYKLINVMKITQLDILAHQMNTKFVNNLPHYWAKYVTNVKNNKDISTTTYVELYTYLKSYEPHAMKTLKKQEQSLSIVDPLAYLASTTHVIIKKLMLKIRSPRVVKENQEKDKIRSKPDKNGKRGEAEKSLKQLQWVEEEKLSKTQKEWPKTQIRSKAIQV
uniref:Integrase, catalytic region, zinc finger, CCHC-type, peptidase aspartic, catalytic n=1 Tax=Tanacetum cinerariifolium TaxID=118510 RepID=A0A6L2JTH1_TANCI|nr:hypothetical protein [Tanacetum cinerariifolium]